MLSLLSHLNLRLPTYWFHRFPNNILHPSLVYPTYINIFLCVTFIPHYNRQRTVRRHMNIHSFIIQTLGRPASPAPIVNGSHGLIFQHKLHCCMQLSSIPHSLTHNVLSHRFRQNLTNRVS
jgi:hypothetical protein